MEAEEGKEAPLVQALLNLSRKRWPFWKRGLRPGPGSFPWPHLPCPGPPSRLSPKALWQAARPFRRAVLALPRETFGLKEAWERLRGLHPGAGPVFQALPLATWGERAVAFAALLEAHRLGLLRLHQEAPFAPLHVEVLQERQELRRLAQEGDEGQHCC
jgi:segregation and condensation protein A